MEAQARARLNDAMARLADGDRDAFREVFGGLRPLIVGFARRFLGAGAEAEDASQQALVAIFECASEYERGRDLVAWALSICAWECRTVRRRRERRREVELDCASGVPIGATPETDTIARDLEDTAREILGELSAEDRETLRLVVDDERPEGVAGTTFRKRKERALARLRQAWRRAHGSG